MLISKLKQCLIIILIAFSPYNKNVSGSNTSSIGSIPTFKLEEVVIKARSYYRTSFLGFRLQQKLNTRVSTTLREALLDYREPKVPISSLRRHGTNSKHCCGKAVDFQWSKELINYLITPEGTAWRDKYGFTFYIEATPGSACLVPYKNDTNYSKYVFENPNATGPHIHLNL